MLRVDPNVDPALSSGSGLSSGSTAKYSQLRCFFVQFAHGFVGGCSEVIHWMKAMGVNHHRARSQDRRDPHPGLPPSAMSTSHERAAAFLRYCGRHSTRHVGGFVEGTSARRVSYLCRRRLGGKEGAINRRLFGSADGHDRTRANE